MQPSTAARYASKALAAHVGMLQSESLVLQYQRRFVEAELQKLQATTGNSQQQQHQLQQQDTQQIQNLRNQHPQQQEEEEQHVLQHRQQQQVQAHPSTWCSNLQEMPVTVSFQVSLQQHAHMPRPNSASFLQVATSFWRFERLLQLEDVFILFGASTAAISITPTVCGPAAALCCCSSQVKLTLVQDCLKQISTELQAACCQHTTKQSNPCQHKHNTA